MEFFIGLIKVIAGEFFLFYTTTEFLLPLLIKGESIKYNSLIGILCFFVMLFYRLTGQSINVPFYTVIGFVVLLNGLSSNYKSSPEIAKLIDASAKKAAVAASLGGVIGWLTFVEQVA